MAKAGEVVLTAGINKPNKYTFEVWYDADGNKRSDEKGYTISNLDADLPYSVKFQVKDLPKLREVVDAALGEEQLAGYTQVSAAAEVRDLCCCF